MASPVAHSIAALAIHEGLDWRRRWAVIAGFILLANLADFDSLVSLVFTGDHNTWHRGPSHSVVFCLLVAGGLAAVWRIGTGYLQRFALFFALLASHLAIDFVTGPRVGAVKAYGQELLWPFSDARFAAPFSLIPGPHHKTTEQIFSWYNLYPAIYEFVTFSVLCGLILWGLRRVRARGSR
jgi:membrane-bound metal-dependent hydrolase YbcI (DUF457 family)